MPGIVGLISKMPRDRAEAQLQVMVSALRHESFYATGTYVDEARGLYLGWIALKGSFSDGMPLQNEREDVTLAFSGEEYPEPGTARRLKEAGHALSLDGSGYLVHLAEEDPSFPAGLNGRFHGLLVDRTRGALTLFNDRYGMHRIYYHEGQEAFYFAGEAKAILAVRPELRRLEPRSFAEYVSCGCVLQNRTLFEGIHVLPPASSWVFADGRALQKARYFEPSDWEGQTSLDPETYYQEFRSVFTRNLARYFDGRGQVAMSLTGGLDGRMIMAWHKPSPGSLPCYTFGDGIGLRPCRDEIVAGQVARACKQPHEVIPVGKEFLSRFPHYAERTVYLSDGCVDLLHSPDLYLNEKARTIAPVRMTGNYGSEVLRRSVAFKAGRPAEGLFTADLHDHFVAAQETYAGLLCGNPISFAVFRQAPWHHYGLLALEQTQLSLRTPYLDNELVRTVFRAPAATLLDNDACLRLIADGDAGLGRIPTDRGLGGNGRGALTLASRRFLEFTFRAEYHYDSGMPQWVAQMDHFLSSFRLERLFLGWHKFHHFRIWYRDILRDYVRQMLLDPSGRTRPYLEPRRLKHVVEGHLKGNRNYTLEIHKLLTLELIHRVFIDAN